MDQIATGAVGLAVFIGIVFAAYKKWQLKGALIALVVIGLLFFVAHGELQQESRIALLKEPPTQSHDSLGSLKLERWMSERNVREKARKEWGDRVDAVVLKADSMGGVWGEGVKYKTAIPVQSAADATTAPTTERLAGNKISEQTSEAPSNDLAKLKATIEQITTASVMPIDLCRANLKRMDLAKQAWALETGKAPGDIPFASHIADYLPGQVLPVCPAGGVYNLHLVGKKPWCSFPGHD